jgi:hypothetical protein
MPRTGEAKKDESYEIAGVATANLGKEFRRCLPSIL